MKTVPDFFLKISLFTILLFFNSSFSQKSLQNLKSGIKEIECTYSEEYTKPDKITFVFTGKEKYVNSYFSNLKGHIFKAFNRNGIPVTFTNESTEEPTFILKVDNAKVIHENDGYDKEIRYELEGILNKNNNTTNPILSFRIIVKTIHDIKQENKKVAEYLLEKLAKS